VKRDRLTVVPVRSYAVPMLVVRWITAYVRVIEVVHERTHGVAIVCGKLCTFLREVGVGRREIGVVPVKRSSVDNHPSVCE
jgi:hypothetical protein